MNGMVTKMQDIDVSRIVLAKNIDEETQAMCIKASGSLPGNIKKEMDNGDMAKEVADLTGDEPLRSEMLDDGLHHHFFSKEPRKSSEKLKAYFSEKGTSVEVGFEKGIASVMAKIDGKEHMFHFFQKPVMKKELNSEENGNSFSVQMEVIKAIPQRRFDRRKKEYRFIKSIAMTPRKIDKQNDWTTEEEIEDACHEFLINLQKTSDPDESGVSYRHQRLVKSDSARIVENTFTDFDETWNGKTFPAGSWKVGIRVYDEAMFPEIDRGELRGCSIEGTAVHTKEPLS